MEENHSMSSTPTATEEEGKFKSINKLTIGLLGAGNEEFMTDPFFEQLIKASNLNKAEDVL